MAAKKKKLKVLIYFKYILYTFKVRLESFCSSLGKMFFPKKGSLRCFLELLEVFL